jgi:hypothetical protein
MISFEFGIDERDEDLVILTSDNFTGVDLVKVTGLMNVYATVVSASTTEIVVKLINKNGKVGGSAITGLVTSSFVSSVGGYPSKIRRTNNTPADVTITVSESDVTKGLYTLTFSTAQTVGSTFQPLAKKDGLDCVTMLGTIATVV